MATPSSTERAGRRSAASAARRAPSADSVPDVLADVVENTASDEAGEASEPLTGETLPPTQGFVNLSRQRLASGSPSNTQVSLKLTIQEEDLTRKIDQADIIVPKLRISQAMSEVNREYTASRGKSGVPMGSWYHSTSGMDLGDRVYFIPVDLRKSRALFVQGQGLVCRSFDMVHGEGDPGIECEGTLEERHTFPENERGCALRLWNREPGGRNIPPPCGVTYNFPGIVVTDIENPEQSKLLTAMLQFRSTGAKAARAIISHVMEMGDGSWNTVIIKLGVEDRTNSKGTFYIPTADFYDTSDTLPPRIVRRAEAFARRMGGVDLRSSIEADGEVAE